MAAKKKTKTKQTRSKRATGKELTPTRKLAKTSAALKKKRARKKPAEKKAAAKAKARGKKKIGAKAGRTHKNPVRGASQNQDTAPLALERSRERSGSQSGDLQGLSRIEQADSESVEELLEEGNAFEADVVTGVENAGNADEKEVRTHEVPENDVPGEYLDKDQ